MWAVHHGRVDPLSRIIPPDFLGSKEPLRPGALGLPHLVMLVTMGCALYGGAVGWWRAGEMAGYVAIKLPLCLLATLAVNGLLNGMLAAISGSGLSFRQTMEAQLHACAIAALVLAGFAPVAAFASLALPSPPHPQLASVHASLLLVHTALIGAAGLAGVLHLRKTLHAWAASPAAARWTMFAWVAGNFFVGAQISWILRPFFGSPRLPVAFLRPDPFESSFYEAIIRAVARLLSLS